MNYLGYIQIELREAVFIRRNVNLFTFEYIYNKQRKKMFYWINKDFYSYCMKFLGIQKENTLILLEVMNIKFFLLIDCIHTVLYNYVHFSPGINNYQKSHFLRDRSIENLWSVLYSDVFFLVISVFIFNLSITIFLIFITLNRRNLKNSRGNCFCSVIVPYRIYKRFCAYYEALKIFLDYSQSFWKCLILLQNLLLTIIFKVLISLQKQFGIILFLEPISIAIFDIISFQ